MKQLKIITIPSIPNNNNKRELIERFRKLKALHNLTIGVNSSCIPPVNTAIRLKACEERGGAQVGTLCRSDFHFLGNVSLYRPELILESAHKRPK